jgi:hypothetical protein
MSLAPPAGPLLLAMRNLVDRCRFLEWDPYAGQDDAASEYFAGFTPAPEWMRKPCGRGPGRRRATAPRTSWRAYPIL